MSALIFAPRLFTVTDRPCFCLEAGFKLSDGITALWQRGYSNMSPCCGVQGCTRVLSQVINSSNLGMCYWCQSEKSMPAPGSSLPATGLTAVCERR